MTTLRRALGRWDLTAIGINQVIGGSIFLLPSQVAVVLGAWSAIAIGLMGLVSLSVALCFAELASRFEGTGGPYLYTRKAFGNFFGFEVGWMQKKLPNAFREFLRLRGRLDAVVHARCK